ncbi:MAG: hypothetical protein PUF04_09790 [bacterium]|nr:hypothetical protein [bacterium]
MSHYIYLIVGASGSGKNTLVNELERVFGWDAIESYTTRPRRPGETRGHTFVTDKEFDQLEGLVAYTEFDGHRYGTTAEQIETHELYIVDPAGVEFYFDTYHGTREAKIIYIKVPEHQRLARMRQRGDAIDAAVQRITHDRLAFAAFEELADLVVSNDIFEKCLLSMIDWINEQEVSE